MHFEKFRTCGAQLKSKSKQIDTWQVATGRSTRKMEANKMWQVDVWITFTFVFVVWWTLHFIHALVDGAGTPSIHWIDSKRSLVSPLHLFCKLCALCYLYMYIYTYFTCSFRMHIEWFMRNAYPCPMSMSLYSHSFFFHSDWRDTFAYFASDENSSPASYCFQPQIEMKRRFVWL